MWISLHILHVKTKYFYIPINHYRNPYYSLVATVVGWPQTSPIIRLLYRRRRRTHYPSQSFAILLFYTVFFQSPPITPLNCLIWCFPKCKLFIFSNWLYCLFQSRIQLIFWIQFQRITEMISQFFFVNIADVFIGVPKQRQPFIYRANFFSDGNASVQYWEGSWLWDLFCCSGPSTAANHLPLRAQQVCPVSWYQPLRPHVVHWGYRFPKKIEMTKMTKIPLQKN